MDDLKPNWLLKYNLDLSGLSGNNKVKPSSLAYLIVSKNYKPSNEEPPMEPTIILQIEDLDHSISSDSENAILGSESPLIRGEVLIY
jgi:hypothetical protein